MVLLLPLEKNCLTNRKVQLRLLELFVNVLQFKLCKVFVEIRAFWHLKIFHFPECLNTERFIFFSSSSFAMLSKVEKLFSKSFFVEFWILLGLRNEANISFKSFNFVFLSLELVKLIKLSAFLMRLYTTDVKKCRLHVLLSLFV
jgi:hypothetical protein